MPNTAYATAKFAVRGFTEALIEDLPVHAPQVRVAVVLPGHVGTDILVNSFRAVVATSSQSTRSPMMASRASGPSPGQHRRGCRRHHAPTRITHSGVPPTAVRAAMP
jgi:NAD(P)-dependent dehydrogenase (short-subunit alcohol dehydrogenase family)